MIPFEKFFLIRESLDNPYRWSNTFKTEEISGDWDDTGEEYLKDFFEPVQIIRFKTDEGVEYVWYARQNRYSETSWEIAFGVNKNKKDDGTYELDIGVTGGGNAFRVFATVLEITNAFIEHDEYYEVRELTLSSKGNNRTSLYLKYLVPKIENFKLKDTRPDGDETIITLERNF